MLLRSSYQDLNNMKLGEQKTALQEAGFSFKEINDWQKDKVAKLSKGGFSNFEIASEFDSVPDDKPFIKYWQGVTEEIKNELYDKDEIVSPEDEMLYNSLQREGDPKSFKDIIVGDKFDYQTIWDRGAGKTLWSLGKRYVDQKGLPEFLSNPEEPEDYTWFEGLLEHATTLGGDLPLYGLSYFPGFLATGNPYAGAFTSGAIPAAARATIIEGLEQQSYAQPVDILKNFLRVGVKEGIKGGTQFAVTALAPQLRLFPGGAKLQEKYITRFLSQLTAFEGSGAALNQQLPSLKEFSYSAVLFAGLGAIQPKATMKDRTKKIYIDTGKKPNQVFIDATKDRTILEDVSSRSFIRAYQSLINRNTKKVQEEARAEEKIIQLKNKNREIYKKAREENEKNKKKVQQEVIEKNPNDNMVEINRKTDAILAERTNKKIEPILNKIKELEKIIENKETTNFNFTEPLEIAAAKNIVKKDKVPMLSKERLIEMGRTAKEIKRQTIIKGIDNKYPVLEIMRDLGVNTKTGIEKLNLYEQLRILEGLPNRAGYFIENKTINNKTLGDKGSGLKEIVEPIIKKGKEELELFETYLLNRRAIELDKRGIESNFDIAVAKEFVNKYKLRFEEFAKKTDTYQRHLLEYAVDGGFLPKAAFDAMTTANKNYVTFARQLIGVDGKPVSEKGSVNPFKLIKGANLKVFPPLEQMVKNTNTIVGLTEKNAVKIKLIEIIEKGKKKNLYPFIKKVNPQKTNLPKEDLMTIRRDGKTETWSVGRELKEALKTMDELGVNHVARFLGAPARTLRAGAILTPDFAVPNFFKDTMQATFLNKVPFVPFADSIIGLFHILTKGNNKKTLELYNKYIKSGGMQSTLLSMDRPNLFEGKVFDILSKGPVRNADKGPLAPLRTLTRLSEEMTRFRIFTKTYKKAKKEGLSEREAIERAGFEARNLLDYAKRGTTGRVINQLVPFWNARVQGLTRLYEAFRDAPTRTLSMVGVTIVLPTLGFYMLNYNNKDYEEQPNFLKMNYWYYEVDGKPKRFPVPFETGTFFKGLVEKTLDWYFKNERKEAIKFAGDFIKQSAKSFYPFPPAITPFLENAANYSVFREAPIVPKSLDKKLPNHFYYTEYTSETFKYYSKIWNGMVGDDSLLATNPIHAEHVFRSWTGGLGRHLIDVLDAALIKGEFIEDPIKPTDTLTKIPIIRAFDVRDVPGYSAKSLVQFYEEYEDVSKIVNGMEKARKDGNTDEYYKLQKQFGADHTVILQYRESIKELDTAIRQIYNSKKLGDGTTITPDEKREMIDRHYMLMINFAQEALKLLEEIRKK